MVGLGFMVSKLLLLNYCLSSQTLVRVWGVKKNVLRLKTTVLFECYKENYFHFPVFNFNPLV